jgi:acetyl esterase/lipase
VIRPRLIRPHLILDFLLTRGQSHRYGPDRSQRADLHLPDGRDPHPVMVVIHGGSWQARYGKIAMRGLAGDLVRRGWAVWNIEYRRLGDGGGWPTTFEDVAMAIDHLAELDDVRLDLSRVSILGHSAGGQLALWAAAREKLPPGAPGAVNAHPRVRLKQAISQAGVCDLVGGYRDWHGGPVRALMGGSPEELPERYAIADPLAHVPLELPVLIVHGILDATVSVNHSRRYARTTLAAGGSVRLVEIDGKEGSHRAHIDPRGKAWAAVVRWLEELYAQ